MRILRLAGLVALTSISLAGCASKVPTLPGEGSTGRPCDQVIPECEARRLENLVLRGHAADGSFISIDGLDTTGVLSFDEALEISWRDGYRGGGKTVQVILGAADAEKLHWGTGTNLYYAIRFEGSCPMAPGNGPAGYEPPPGAFDCDATTETTVNAHTGEVIGTGQTDPP